MGRCSGEHPEPSTPGGRVQFPYGPHEIYTTGSDRQQLKTAGGFIKKPIAIGKHLDFHNSTNAVN